MGANLGLGGIVISMTVLVHTIGLIVLSWTIVRLIEWSRQRGYTVPRTFALVPAVLGLFLILTVEVWMWAVFYKLLGVTTTFEESLYFSTVTFSTVGFGDVVPAHGWRLFSALEGINGFLMIGWSTAYLVAASTRHGPFRAGEHF